MPARAKASRLLLPISLLGAYLLPLVHAETYDLSELPGNVGTYFNIGDFAGGLIVSAIFLLFPTAMIMFACARAKTSGETMFLAVLICDFVLMGFLVALTWLPYWIFLVVCLLVAIMFAGKIRDLITGK